MRELIRDREKIFDFSLHDSRIKKFSIKDDNLIFSLDYVFQYFEDGEKGYEAEIVFKDCYLDDIWVLIYDHVLSEGRFEGIRMGIEEFIKQYKNQEFEIITEGYCGFFKIFTGWLWKDGIPVSAQLEIWHSGDMVYRIGKQLF